MLAPLIPERNTLDNLHRSFPDCPLWALFHTARHGRHTTQYTQSTPARRRLPILAPSWPPSELVQQAQARPRWSRWPQARLHWGSSSSPPSLRPYAPTRRLPTRTPPPDGQARSTHAPMPLSRFSLTSLSPLKIPVVPFPSPSPCDPLSLSCLPQRCLIQQRVFALYHTLLGPARTTSRRSYVRSFDSPVDSASARIETLSTLPDSLSQQGKQKKKTPPIIQVSASSLASSNTVLTRWPAARLAKYLAHTSQESTRTFESRRKQAFMNMSLSFGSDTDYSS